MRMKFASQRKLLEKLNSIDFITLRAHQKL